MHGLKNSRITVIAFWPSGEEQRGSWQVKREYAHSILDAGDKFFCSPVNFWLIGSESQRRRSDRISGDGREGPISLGTRAGANYRRRRGTYAALALWCWRRAGRWQSTGAEAGGLRSVTEGVVWGSDRKVKLNMGAEHPNFIRQKELLLRNWQCIKMRKFCNQVALWDT